MEICEVIDKEIFFGKVKICLKSVANCRSRCQKQLLSVMEFSPETISVSRRLAKAFEL